MLFCILLQAILPVINVDHTLKARSEYHIWPVNIISDQSISCLTIQYYIWPVNIICDQSILYMTSQYYLTSQYLHNMFAWFYALWVCFWWLRWWFYQRTSADINGRWPAVIVYLRQTIQRAGQSGISTLLSSLVPIILSPSFTSQPLS